MAYTLEEIRGIVQSGCIAADFSNPICTKQLKQFNSIEATCYIYAGWDLVKANQIDQTWLEYRYDLIEFIASKSYTSEELKEIEKNIQFGDNHWNWFNKSCKYKSDEYQWFYLYSDNKPQAVCLIYHPKTSILSGNNIFYIEYIAVAPWNRKNPMAPKQFTGLGQILMQFIIHYASSQLGLSFGFSLHSLPGARSFYTSIGMQNIPTEDKEGLGFFEMPHETTAKFMEGS